MGWAEMVRFVTHRMIEQGWWWCADGWWHHVSWCASVPVTSLHPGARDDVTPWADVFTPGAPDKHLHCSTPPHKWWPSEVWGLMRGSHVKWWTMCPNHRVGGVSIRKRALDVSRELWPDLRDFIRFFWKIMREVMLVVSEDSCLMFECLWLVWDSPAGHQPQRFININITNADIIGHSPLR